MLKKYDLAYELDDPKATLAHREIILQKPFLKRLYQDWYKTFLDTAKSVGHGKYLEIGSGGGFLKEEFPDVITSDILDLDVVDQIFSAEELPFEDATLGCIMMLNVFHHIPRPHLFLKEAERTLVPGGKVIMIEPANSIFGRLIYQNLHHEPFDPHGPREIEAGNPLSNSNQALPFIYFERDSELFKTEFPELKINCIKYHTPLRYLLSGGVSRSALVPFASYGLIQALESIGSCFNRYTGMFCTIELERKK